MTIPTDYQTASLRFKAMAHPVRLQILDMLRQREICVCHLEAVLKKRQAYISQQLMVLREAGLVDTRKDGLRVFYRLADDQVRDLLDSTLGPLPETGFPLPPACPYEDCAHIRREARLRRKQAANGQQP